MEKTTWYGPNTCDFCGRNCQKTLYDGKTKLGTWATMCRTCFTENGVGLGYGVGQRYKLNPKTQKYELDVKTATQKEFKFKTYIAKYNPRASGLNFKIDRPTYWPFQMPDCPHDVCKFGRTHYNGISIKMVIVWVSVKKISDKRLSILNSHHYFSAENTKARLKQKNYHVISCQKITVSGIEGWLIEYSTGVQSEILTCHLLYKNYFIEIFIYTSWYDCEENLYTKFKPTYLKIINSFTILDE